MTAHVRDGPARSRGWVTWSFLGLGTHGLGQFVLLAVLARHLTKVEFGVMTATLIVVNLGRALHSALAPALVQREDLRPDHVRSAFALATLAALLLFASMWLLAPLAAGFFAMPQLVDVMPAMGLLFVLQAAGLVPEALLQREMQMRALALAEICGVVLGLLPIGIGCALAGLGVWSLVAGYLAQALVKCLALVLARPHERALWPVRGATWHLLHYSGGFAAARLCNVAAVEGDKFVIARFLAPAMLGVYGRAYQLMAMPAMFLGEVVDRIVFPLLARVQSDKESLCRAYARGVSLSATIMAPAAAVCIVLAPEIVGVVLGPEWPDVVLPFRILMAGLVFRTGYKISDMLARATGTVYARAWRQGVFALLIVAGALAGCAWGVAGVATGVVAAVFSNYLLMAHLSKRTTGLSWARFAALHVRGLLCGAAAGLGVGLATAAIRSVSDRPLVVLLGVLAMSGACGAAALRLAPRHILGADGLWLLSTLWGRERARPPGQVADRRLPEGPCTADDGERG